MYPCSPRPCIIHHAEGETGPDLPRPLPPFSREGEGGNTASACVHGTASGADSLLNEQLGHGGGGQKWRCKERTRRWACSRSTRRGWGGMFWAAGLRMLQVLYSKRRSERLWCVHPPHSLCRCVHSRLRITLCNPLDLQKPPRAPCLCVIGGSFCADEAGMSGPVHASWKRPPLTIQTESTHAPGPRPPPRNPTAAPPFSGVPGAPQRAPCPPPPCPQLLAEST